MHFKKSKTKHKPNNIWVDQVSEFYNRSIKSSFYDSSIKMYTIYNEERSIVAARFIRIFKSKIYEHMTAVSKNVYIDKVDEINKT